ncbi:PA14 domain-containing protein, partial [Bacillus sp. V33-4]|uniref:PA14 domain-containing protein n=1 Tax=Bacillus sp. V33-4 TaxID=2054169 RepID=UPI000CC68994
WGWGNGSPHPSVPGDGFSARFTKKENLEAGTYIFRVNGDDGARVLLDGEPLISAQPYWGSGELKKEVNIVGGQHTITVEYFEDVALAKLFFYYESGLKP